MVVQPLKLLAGSDSGTKLSATCSLRMNLIRSVSSCSLNLQLRGRLYQFTSLISLADRHKLSEKEALWKLCRLTVCLLKELLLSIDTVTCVGRIDHLVVVSFLKKSIVDRSLEQFTFILIYANKLHLLFSELGFCS
jgi:hypothetical protein